MPAWPDQAELGPRQTANPILWQTEWKGPLPAVTADQLLAIHGPGKGHRVLTYGHAGGNKRNGRDPHFITTRSGYGMHTDDGFVRFTHQVVLYNGGWNVHGLAGQGDPQRRRAVYCLDTWSPHIIAPDPRLGTGIYKLQAAVDSDRPMTFAEVVEALTALLSVKDAHMQAAPE